MGIYIPNMEPPLIGEHIIIGATSSGKTVARNENLTEWCDIVLVPDHARLIDADALEDRLNKLCEDSPTLTQMANDFINAGICASIKCLSVAPTIIPAEREDA